MAEQLVLLSNHHTPSWKIDDQTKEIGLSGVARARAILSCVNHDAAANESRIPSHAA